MRCINCCRWGSPWRLQKVIINCEEKRDTKGEFFSPEHIACDYFIPKQELPSFHKFKLLVQTLSSSEKKILKWVLEQNEDLLGLKDSKGEVLSLGDYIKFKLDVSTYLGIVEGINKRTETINCFCPAFPKANISLITKSIVKLTQAELKAIQFGSSAFEKETLGWHMECLLEEILRLKSLPSLTALEYQELVKQQQRWEELDSRLRYLILAKDKDDYAIR